MNIKKINIKNIDIKKVKDDMMHLLTLAKQINYVQFFSTNFLIVIAVCVAIILGYVLLRPNQGEFLLHDNSITLQHDTYRVLLINRDNSKNNFKTRLNLRGFVRAANKLPSIDYTIIEGVGDDISLLQSIINENVQEKGVRHVFLYGMTYNIEMSNIFRKHPNVTFFMYGSHNQERNVINFLLRTYMAKFLLGYMAGNATNSNLIGYVSEPKNTWNSRSINAFALGVARANPKAKVVLSWDNTSTDPKVNKQHIAKMIENTGIDVISGSLESCQWCEVAHNKDNLLFLGEYIDESPKYGDRYLGSYLYNLEPVYDYFLTSIVNNTPGMRSDYSFGAKLGAVALTKFSRLVSPKVRNFVEDEILAIQNEISFIFRGPIYSNEDMLIVAEDTTIPDTELRKGLTWLNSNIQVYEPDYGNQQMSDTENIGIDPQLDTLTMQDIDDLIEMDHLGDNLYESLQPLKKSFAFYRQDEPQNIPNESGQ